MSQPNNSEPTVPKKYLFAFILVTSLFALWGFANDITNPLVAAFKDVFVIDNTQSSLVQLAFYGGYATMALPAALFIRKFSYKAGILLGLSLYVVGAFCTVPAAMSRDFNLFLIALYVLTIGLAFLETTANPYILSMGPRKTATRRLNLAQAFNPIGSLTGMVVASTVILANLEVEDYRKDVRAAQIDLQIESHAAGVDGVDAPKESVIEQVQKSAAGDLGKEDGFVYDQARDVESSVSAWVEAQVANSPEKAPEKAEDTRSAGKKAWDFTRSLVGISDPDTKPLDVRRDGYGKILGASLGDFKEGEIQEYAGMDFQTMQDKDLTTIRTPYMVLGIVVLLVLGIFILKKMPDTRESLVESDTSIGATFKRLFHNKRYLFGIVAQMFYVGAQIMCWTFIIQYAQTNLDMDKASAQNWNILAMVVFLSGRFICTFLIKYVNPSVLLALLAVGGILTTAGAIFLDGYAGLYSLVAISACMSLMFPTIYGIALENMGEDAKLASAGLVFAIVGGALMPALQGRIIDSGDSEGLLMGIPSVSFSFFLPLICFVVIAIYGILCFTKIFKGIPDSEEKA